MPERYDAARLSHPIDRLVRGDLVEPRALVASARRRPRAERGEKCLLKQIVGLRTVPGEPKDVGEDFALVALQELTEGHRSDLTTIERVRLA